MDTNHNYMIDDYLTGRLNQRESADFEKQMQADQELRAEVDFQRGVIEGIRTYRKAELKARLAAVPAPEPTGLLGNAAGKVITGVAASVVVLGGLYWFSQDTEITPAPTSFDQKSIEVTSPEVYRAPQLSLDLDIVDRTSSSARSQKVEQEVNENRAVVDEAATSVVEEPQQEIAENKDQDVFTPTIVLPEDVSDIDSDKSFESDPISRELFEKSSASPEEQVDIEVKKSKVEEFAYKYFDSKLTLIGDFDKSPYQILELIGPSGKDIFLYYDNSYYEIKLTSEAKKLIPIQDVAKLKELEILKNYK